MCEQHASNVQARDPNLRIAQPQAAAHMLSSSRREDVQVQACSRRSQV
jgi:hypothetical protein